MAKASNPPANYTQRRLNLRGLIILAVVLVVGVAAFFPLKAVSDRATRRSALDQAKASEASGNIDLALRHMERYTASWPNDLPGLEYQAKLLSKTAANFPQIFAAAQANDKVLRLDPNSPERQDVRRRLVRLYVQYSDILRERAQITKESAEAASELRYRAAETVARQLLADGGNEAEDHRLLAAALEGSIAGGDVKPLPEAIAEYQKAMVLDPKDVIAPSRLAQLQLVRKKDPAAAEATLDALLKAQPDSVPVRLTRYDFYNRSMKNEAKAKAELEAASQMAPKDVRVQTIAAEDAIFHRDFDSARRHLDAIADDKAHELEVRTLRGRLELSEKHPDEAIEEWRKGLVAVSGSNVDLTWQLAYTLIQLGRLVEARPLVSRFQQLGGDEADNMYRFLRSLYELRAGHPDPAIKDLKRVAELVRVEWRPEVYLALGRGYESLGDEGQAMVAYQKAAALVPAAAEPRRAISRILAIKNPADARTEMERALTQNPTDLPLLVEVGRLRLRQQASLPENQRRWERVDDIVARALKLDPNNFTVQTLQADVLAASGRLPEALGLLKKSVAGPGKHKLEIWLTYIGALDRLGRQGDALKAISEATSPDVVGDHTPLRIARARILARTNQGQAAREALTVDREKLPRSERPELAHALAELCRELGDREGARLALADWAKQLPDSAEPGLALIAFAQAQNDDEAARLGLEALRTLGVDQEAFGLAARALELLRIEQTKANPAESEVTTNPADLKRLDEAQRLVTQLNAEAPQLAVVPMLQGLILERRGKIDEAIEAYRRSVKDATMTPALARLVELLSRRDRFDEIERLKARYESRANADGTPSLITSFDQITAAVAVKLGDNRRALQSVADMAEAQPDNLAVRVSLAQLFAKVNQPKDGEATLRQLANRRPNDPAPWGAMVGFRALHPELGDSNKLIDEVRVGYKGAHPELLIARSRSILGDKSGAARLFDAAVAQNGDDLDTLRDAIDFDQTNNRTKEAEVKLRKALAINPKTPWAARTLALILTSKPDQSSWQEAWALIKTGAPGAGIDPEDRLVKATILARSPEKAQRDEAAPALEALANDLPASHPLSVQVRTRLAQAFLLSNRVEEAVRTIAPVAEDNDRPNALALAISIEALVRARDAATASKRLPRLEALEPKAPMTAASKAWVLVGSGKPDEAVAVVEAAYTEAEGTNGGELVALAFEDLLMKLDLKDAAYKLAERIAVKWPKDAYILARLQLAANKNADVIKSCQIAIEAGEVREAIRVATKLAIDKRDDAATLQVVDELASAALAQAPKSPEVAALVATLRHLEGRFEEEVALYHVALDNAPPGYGFLNNMAWTLSDGLQRHEEALERVDEAIRRDGRLAEYLDTRGVILERLGRREEAVKDLEESTKGFPSASTYFHLARNYRELKKMDDYRRCRDMATKLKINIKNLDPNDKADFSTVMNGG